LPTEHEDDIEQGIDTDRSRTTDVWLDHALKRAHDSRESPLSFELALEEGRRSGNRARFGCGRLPNVAVVCTRKDSHARPATPAG